MARGRGRGPSHRQVNDLYDWQPCGGGCGGRTLGGRPCDDCRAKARLRDLLIPHAPPADDAKQDP